MKTIKSDHELVRNIHDHSDKKACNITKPDIHMPSTLSNDFGQLNSSLLWFHDIGMCNNNYQCLVTLQLDI